MLQNLKLTIILLLVSISLFAQRPWQKITDPGLKNIQSEFQTPPPQYGMILWWGWDGAVTDSVIRHDLDLIRSQGFRGVMIEAGYGMTARYLSPEWFQLVKVAVEEARKRDMIVWAEDEGKYPSGFAGGKFSAERPDLKMQGLVVTERINAAAGEKISRKLKPDEISAVAFNKDDSTTLILDASADELKWDVPPGNWIIIVAGHQFKTAPTRSVNNPTRGKDTSASLFDFLNPEGTRQFLDWTHEQYKKYIGQEFGKTFMGFMGDEPDFAYTPWTPAMLKEFRKRKGYDIQPYLASFFSPHLTEEMKRAKADYWDVWSSLFSENFFTVQAEWCRRNNIDYIVHLNHEDMAPQLVRSGGDYFKNMRNVGVPGVDAIWSQIWMDHVADYPKLASSAAHIFGKPRAFTESFAAYTYRPTVTQAKWVIDYQLVRGINSVQIMFMSASTRKPAEGNTPRRTSFFLSDTFPPVAKYVNRATYLLSLGRPAARIGLYYPTTSMWYGDNESNRSVLAIAKELSENQRDYDFIDEQALSSVLKPEKGSLKNLSGQSYQAVIVPSISVISKAALNKLKAFSASGGKVIFMGKLPELVTDKTFLKADKLTNIDWALKEPSEKLTDKIKSALPGPDVLLKAWCPSLKYIRRNFNDGEMYFFFNESNQTQSREITLSGAGKAEIWDAMTGEIKSLSGTAEASAMKFAISFEPYETKIIVIRK